MQKYHDEPKQYKGYLKSALVEPATRASVSMRAFVATLNPSGRVPRALWSCVYPAVAGNKSFALQFAALVR